MKQIIDISISKNFMIKITIIIKYQKNWNNKIPVIYLLVMLGFWQIYFLNYLNRLVNWLHLIKFIKT